MANFVSVSDSVSEAPMITKKLEFRLERSACLLICCLLLIGQVQESRQLVIKSIKVPSLVREGESDYVILDCDYDLGNSSADGLVVKWTNNDVLEYKWHTGHQPQAVPGASHIEVGYKASDDPVKMYRAMKIINPNISLTGNYKCDVFNYIEEDIANASMIVYSTEEKFDLIYSKRSFDGEDGVEVFCSAEGLYPHPVMDISINNASMNETSKFNVTTREDGKYDIMTRVSLKDDDLTNPPALIKCTLGIPKVDYHIPQELVYYPGTPTTTPSSTTNLPRTMGSQALDSTEPDTGNGGGSIASTASTGLIFVGLLVVGTMLG